jgi:hypothetical protein
MKLALQRSVDTANKKKKTLSTPFQLFRRQNVLTDGRYILTLRSLHAKNAPYVVHVLALAINKQHSE